MTSSYLPMERWQHNLEHGCIVVLYHPCLATHHVLSVISLVSGCLKKFVSTPSGFPDSKHPLILVGWGAYRKFSSLDKKAMLDFVRRKGYNVDIQRYFLKLLTFFHGLFRGNFTLYSTFSHGLKAPEGAFPDDGKYNHLQTHKSSIRDDKIHC